MLNLLVGSHQLPNGYSSDVNICQMLVGFSLVSCRSYSTMILTEVSCRSYSMLMLTKLVAEATQSWCWPKSVATKLLSLMMVSPVAIILSLMLAYASCLLATQQWCWPKSVAEATQSWCWPKSVADKLLNEVLVSPVARKLLMLMLT